MLTGSNILTLKQRIERAGMADLYRTKGLNRAQRRAEMRRLLQDPAIEQGKRRESLPIMYREVEKTTIPARVESKKEGFFGRAVNKVKKIFNWRRDK